MFFIPDEPDRFDVTIGFGNDAIAAAFHAAAKVGGIAQFLEEDCDRNDDTAYVVDLRNVSWDMVEKMIQQLLYEGWEPHGGYMFCFCIDFKNILANYRIDELFDTNLPCLC